MPMLGGVADFAAADFVEAVLLAPTVDHFMG
jgi:hypothetical protein